MKVAKLDTGGRRLVIDYDLLSSSGDVTLDGDTTYLVSSPVNITGVFTIEGGTVVKFSYTNGISLSGYAANIVCLTSAYRTAVFSSMNDNSVGQVISGSTGTPTVSDTYIIFTLQSTQAMTLRYLRFCYAATAISGTVHYAGDGYNSDWIKIWDCQFFDCTTAFEGNIQVESVLLYIYNALFSQVTNGVIEATGSDGTLTISAVNVTADNMMYFTTNISSANVSATNSVFTSIENPPASSSLYNCASYSSSSGLYTNVGAAGYYLCSGSTNRGAGTANIDAGLLADLGTLTTYAPGVIQGFITGNSNLGTNVARNTGTPDIGYHYCPIDWALNVGLENSTLITLTVSNGTALAGFGSGGVQLTTNGVFNCNGTATSPVYLVKYNMVQEQSNTNWATTPGRYYSLQTPGQTDSSSANLSFTQLSAFGNDYQIDPFISEIPCTVTLENCQMYSGIVDLNGQTLVSSNSLYARVATTLYDIGASDANTFGNNLFWNGSLTVKHSSSGGHWTFRDNLFDQCNITNKSGANINLCLSNAYATNLLSSPQYLPGETRIVPLAASPAYQTGTLGQFYYPSAQTNLIFYGSQLASAAGLYHYTVTANNTIDGTNMVSIGFHYVATDANGIPLDSDGDGVPDYVKDSNGDGVYDAGDLANWLDPFTIYDQGRSYGGYYPSNVRLGYWRFNNAISLTNEAGKYPTTANNTTTPADWSTTSVFINSDTELAYNLVDAGNWTNLDAANGTVRFWFKPHWSSTNIGGSGPGSFGMFVTIGGSWDWYLQSNGCVVGFTSYSNTITAPYFGQGAAPGFGGVDCTFVDGLWYQLALAYSPSNIAMYMNGALLATANFTPYSVVSNEEAHYDTGFGMFVWPTGNTPFSIGCQLTNAFQINGEFDEMETFNYPLSAAAIAYGFATFNGCSTNNEQDTDYVGRSDVLRKLVDGVNNLATQTNGAPCRLGYWRFDTNTWLGEQGQFPISANGVSLATGWSGGAVNVGSAANSGLTYPDVYSNGWANINCRQGTVRFWFEPNWSSGPTWAPVIYLGNGTENEWTLGFSGSSPELVFETSSNTMPTQLLITSPLSVATNQWCQIVLTYGPNGCALYTNGILAKSNSSGVTLWPNAADRALGMVIGNTTAYNSPANGKFDELETFNYQLNTNQIWTNFQAVWNIDNNLDGIPDIIQDTILSGSTPFLGQPVVVAGTIEAEQFDRGGSNVAYLNVAQNPTNGYRITGMCITNCSDLGLGYCLDQTRAGEWAKYTINVLVPQTYAVQTRVESLGTGGWFEETFSNSTGVYASTGPLQIPGSGWTNVTSVVTLEAGTSVMTLKFLTNGSGSSYVGRFNYITIYPWWQAGFASTYTNAASGLTSGVNTWTAATNNTYRLQQALNSVVGMGGGTVSIPSGTYYVAQFNPNETNPAWANAVVNIATNNIAITGAGMTSTVLVAFNRATTIVDFGTPPSTGVPVQCTNFTLENITFQAQPHMAVSNGMGTNLVYETGQLHPLFETFTGMLAVFEGLSSNACSRNILVANCEFLNADTSVAIFGYASNVMIQSSSFITWQGTNGYVPGQTNNPGTNTPNTGPYYFGVGIFADDFVNNIGVVGCTFDGNPNATGYITSQEGAANGFLYFEYGGNWFAMGNFVTNNAEEAMQFVGGPTAVAGNTFHSWANNWAALALAAQLDTFYQGLTGYGQSNYSTTFVGNWVWGNIFGECVDNFVNNGQFTLNFSGNYLDLFLEVANPYTNGGDGAMVYVTDCQPLNVCGNTLVQGEHGISFAGESSNSVILANNFIGVEHSSIIDLGSGSTTVEDAQVINNILSYGDSYHLKVPFSEGPNWFLYNNQYINSASNAVLPFLDAASLPAHITY
jgi:hypothetical protein